MGKFFKFARVASLVAALLAPALSATAQFSYTTKNGGITITGYSGPGGNVAIPSAINGLPVTAIADGAFQNQSNLNVLTIPNSVTNIGSRAFAGCIWLFGVIMPTNFPSIGDYAFWECFQLTGLTIPSGVTNIGTATG